MRLIACPSCHAQYDVTNVARKQIDCSCGERIDNQIPAAIETEVRRCSACGAQLSGADTRCDYCGSDVVRDRRRLSLICPSCCARNAECSRFCQGCGIPFRPQPVSAGEDEHEFPCPACSALMPPRRVGDVLVNECPSCNGIWAAEERFETLVNRALEAKRSGDTSFEGFSPRLRGGNPAAQQVLYRKCPECDAYMQRRNFRKTSGVILDRCKEHGVWLDMDELEQIAGFLASGGRPRAADALRESEAQAEAAYQKARLERVASQSVARTGFGSPSSGGTLSRTLLGVLGEFFD